MTTLKKDEEMLVMEKRKLSLAQNPFLLLFFLYMQV